MWLTALVAAEHAMAANQGLYNAFLVAGLLWALIAGDALWQLRLACFFLGCVVVAGAYGSMTVGRKIFFVQGLPALLALVAVLVG